MKHSSIVGSLLSLLVVHNTVQADVKHVAVNEKQPALRTRQQKLSLFDTKKDTITKEDNRSDRVEKPKATNSTKVRSWNKVPISRKKSYVDDHRRLKQNCISKTDGIFLLERELSEVLPPGFIEIDYFDPDVDVTVSITNKFFSDDDEPMTWMEAVAPTNSGSGRVTHSCSSKSDVLPDEGFQLTADCGPNGIALVSVYVYYASWVKTQRFVGANKGTLALTSCDYTGGSESGLNKPSFEGVAFYQFEVSCSVSNQNVKCPVDSGKQVSESPSSSPTKLPSTSPSASPSVSPSISPSNLPSSSPSRSPSAVPSRTPTSVPSSLPSQSPSKSPSKSPSTLPSSLPSSSPSSSPSNLPSSSPSTSPSSLPTSSQSPTEHGIYCVPYTDGILVLKEELSEKIPTGFIEVINYDSDMDVTVRIKNTFFSNDDTTMSWMEVVAPTNSGSNGATYSCSSKSDVGPDDKVLLTAQCTNATAMVEVFAYYASWDITERFNGASKATLSLSECDYSNGSDAGATKPSGAGVAHYVFEVACSSSIRHPKCPVDTGKQMSESPSYSPTALPSALPSPSPSSSPLSSQGNMPSSLPSVSPSSLPSALEPPTIAPVGGIPPDSFNRFVIYCVPYTDGILVIEEHLSEKVPAGFIDVIRYDSDVDVTVRVKNTFFPNSDEIMTWMEVAAPTDSGSNGAAYVCSSKSGVGPNDKIELTAQCTDAIALVDVYVYYANWESTDRFIGRSKGPIFASQCDYSGGSNAGITKPRGEGRAHYRFEVACSSSIRHPICPVDTGKLASESPSSSPVNLPSSLPSWTPSESVSPTNFPTVTSAPTVTSTPTLRPSASPTKFESYCVPYTDGILVTKKELSEDLPDGFIEVVNFDPEKKVTVKIKNTFFSDGAVTMSWMEATAPTDGLDGAKYSCSSKYDVAPDDGFELTAQCSDGTVFVDVYVYFDRWAKKNRFVGASETTLSDAECDYSDILDKKIEKPSGDGVAHYQFHIACSVANSHMDCPIDSEKQVSESPTATPSWFPTGSPTGSPSSSPTESPTSPRSGLPTCHEFQRYCLPYTNGIMVIEEDKSEELPTNFINVASFEPDEEVIVMIKNTFFSCEDVEMTWMEAVSPIDSDIDGVTHACASKSKVVPDDGFNLTAQCSNGTAIVDVYVYYDRWKRTNRFVEASEETLPVSKCDYTNCSNAGIAKPSGEGVGYYRFEIACSMTNPHPNCPMDTHSTSDDTLVILNPSPTPLPSSPPAGFGSYCLSYTDGILVTKEEPSENLPIDFINVVSFDPDEEVTVQINNTFFSDGDVTMTWMEAVSPIDAGVNGATYSCSSKSGVKPDDGFSLTAQCSNGTAMVDVYVFLGSWIGTNRFAGANEATVSASKCDYSSGSDAGMTKPSGQSVAHYKVEIACSITNPHPKCPVDTNKSSPSSSVNAAQGSSRSSSASSTSSRLTLKVFVFLTLMILW